MSDTLRAILREMVREEARAAVREEFAALLDTELPRPKGRIKARNGSRGWTEADKRSLVSDIRHGMTIQEAADKYGRTASAIRDRLYHGKWGLLVNDNRPDNVFSAPHHLL
jgi:hypothetical protein